MLPQLLYIFNFFGYIYVKKADGNGILQAFRSEFCSQKQTNLSSEIFKNCDQNSGRKSSRLHIIISAEKMLDMDRNLLVFPEGAGSGVLTKIHALSLLNS